MPFHCSITSQRCTREFNGEDCIGEFKKYNFKKSKKDFTCTDNPGTCERMVRLFLLVLILSHFYCRFVSVISNSPKALRRQWIHTISRTTSSTDSTKTKVNQFDLLWVYILLRMQTTLRTGPTQMLPQHCWAPVTVRT